MERLTGCAAVDALYHSVHRLPSFTPATRATVMGGTRVGGSGALPTGAIEAPVVEVEVVVDDREGEGGGGGWRWAGWWFGGRGKGGRCRHDKRHQHHHREGVERVLFYMLRVGGQASPPLRSTGRGGVGGEGPGAPPEVVFIAATHDIKGTHVAVAEVARGLWESRRAGEGGGGEGGGDGGKKRR